MIKLSMTPRWTLALVLVATVNLFGCATRTPLDYTEFQRARPASLLVMPPVNDSPDVKATPGVWAQATMPLAEAGYYVLPAALVDETFQQNGVTTAHDAAQIPYEKLRDFFGADAAVFIRVKKYGTSYAIVVSDTRVELEAKIVDLRTGVQLWQGTAVASSTEQQQQGGGLAGLLVAALINQVVGTATDAAFKYAAVADARLLSAPQFNGVLPGPRSKFYGQPLPSR